jgi:uncharacterized membrane protein YhaH (DUF805 family)
MKWFFLALRKYADFSGRAQRKEYWMFLLFYYIFMIAISFVSSIVSLITGVKDLILMSLNAYILLMILPLIAITIRRVHDTGKSGWWVFIGWLILMLEKGQEGDNKYGAGPKTSTLQKPDEKARLENVAVTVIVAASWRLLFLIIFMITYNIPVNVDTAVTVVLHLLFLLIGILLFQNNSSGTIEKARRRVFVPLIVYGAAMTLLFVVYIIVFNSGIFNIWMMFQYLVLLFFAVTLAMPDKELLKTASIILITVSCITVIMNIVWSSMLEENTHIRTIALLRLLDQISFILLAGVFMPRKTATAPGGYSGQRYPGKGFAGTQQQPVNKQPAAQPATGNAHTGKTYYERDNRGMRVETLQQSIAYWTGERMQSVRKDPFVCYAFADVNDARHAMLALPFIHIAVDTGKMICDEVFRFGYYATNNGGYEAFITGADLTVEHWETTGEIFRKYNGTKKSDLKPEKSASAVSQDAGDVTKVKFVREDRDDTAVWRVHSAPGKADALAFLSKQTVKLPLFYIVVETPDGNFGKDKDGVYQE